MKKLPRIVYKFLISSHIGAYLVRNVLNIFFCGSEDYWERRYHKNGNSGVGSYGESARYKAAFVNQFVSENKIYKVIELGCGDGNQLQQFHFPEYIGFDVSPTAIEMCRNKFKSDRTKSFFLYKESTIVAAISDLQAELALSLDVIYHLVEDKVYEKYMHDLFSFTSKYVIIYAWDAEEGKKYHVRHRKFTRWIDRNIPDFQLIQRVSNNFYCDFFIYKKDYLC